jgi:hypothetical protein
MTGNLPKSNSLAGIGENWIEKYFLVFITGIADNSNSDTTVRT